MITIYSFIQDYLQQMLPRLRVTLHDWKDNCIFKINESQYIALCVISGSIKNNLSIHCVNIYFPQSIVSYLFTIDLKVWGYPTLVILWFINFKKANYQTFASSKSSAVTSYNQFYEGEGTNIPLEICFYHKKWKRCFEKTVDTLLSIYRQNLTMQNIR